MPMVRSIGSATRRTRSRLLGLGALRSRIDDRRTLSRITRTRQLKICGSYLQQGTTPMPLSPSRARERSD